MQDGIPIGRKDATNGVHLNQAHLFNYTCIQEMMQSCRYYTRKAMMHVYRQSITTGYKQ